MRVCICVCVCVCVCGGGTWGTIQQKSYSSLFCRRPLWTSHIVGRRVVGRCSYSPQARHPSSSFGAWWGDSLTRRHAPNDDARCPACGNDENLPISLRKTTREHGGEILLLAPGWTSLVVVRRVVGRCPTMRQKTMKDVQPGLSNTEQADRPKGCGSLVQSILRHI